MDYRSYSEELRRRKLDRPATRWFTGAVILTLHVVIIGMTVLWGGGCRSTKEPKEKIYKVKLGGSEPSHAPEVGPPERLRPTGDPSPPVPSEPAVAPSPKPVPKEPKVTPSKPKPVPKEPKVRPTRPKPKSRPKPVPKEPKVVNSKVRPQSKSKPAPREPGVKPSSSARQNSRNNRQQAKQRPKDDGIYHPPGGSNFNPNVKIGSRDTGQLKGPADHRTPMAGKDDEADRKWQSDVQTYVDRLWTPPENVFWGDNPPQAVLELVIASDGRVLRARLVKSSGNARMDGTIQNLIQQLKGRKAPVPPGGQQTIEVELIPR